MKRVFREAILFSIPQSIWGVGWVTLWMNMSTIIIFSLSPIYLTSVLGVSAFEVGIFEGILEAIAWFTRIFAGFISDYLRKRKPLLILAYGLVTVSRPLFAVAPTITWLFVSRTMDRVGNGLQATPREALVGDLSPPHLKGASYGLRQTLATLGSMIGALIILYWFERRGDDFKAIFLFASLTPLIALLTLIFLVRDSPLASPKPKRETFFHSFIHIQDLTPAYWIVVFVAAVYMFSNYSGAFLILQAKSKVVKTHIVPIVMVFQNFAAMISAYPIGRLSDRVDRRKLLAVGFGLTILSNTCLAFAEGIVFISLGAAFWGAQIGITQSLFVAKVADTTQEKVRATAFGLYYAAIGLTLLASNGVIGWVFHHISPAAAFHVSSVAAGLAIICLPLMRPSLKAPHLPSGRPISLQHETKHQK